MREVVLGKLAWLHFGVLPLLLLFALWWLVRGGRGGAAGAGRYPKAVFRAALVLALVLFGLVAAGEPNPVTPLKAFFAAAPATGWRSGLLLLLFFSLLAVAGTKLVCGWGCPFGAAQELLYEVPLFRPIKRQQLPFFLTMPLRTLFFAAFLLVPLGGAGLYQHLDPFALFARHPGRAALIAGGGFLLLSLFVYRPFCQLLCPFGWYSWFLERFSLFGIRIDRRTCVRCNACARACPLEAARGRLLASPVPADCFSCARCLRVCPTGAIDYGWRLGRRRSR